MATTGWRSDRPLNQCLRDDYAQFDWYQLVRLLLAERSPDSTAEALDEHIRFRSELSLAFPASEVTAVVDSGNGAAVTITTPNYGVAGYLGPLPESFTEWLRERRAAGDGAMADFLDLFNHRLSSLRYRMKARVHTALDRRQPQDTPLAQRVAALIGLSAPGLTEQLPVPRRALLGMAGLLANRRRNPDTIERVLGRYLGANVVIRAFQGGWLNIPATDHTLLGKTNNVLGQSAVLGERTWDQAAAIEVRIGPISHDALCDLLPGGSRHAALAAMLRFLTDAQVDCRVRLLTHAADAPAAALSAVGDSSSQLGRTTWLGPSSEGLREATFTVPAHAVEPTRAA